ncbi:hypothetical protein [Bradyrhizobium ottawaense]|uniref:hypothetical protein n=1 Tax=Bradyrhizobium ottawaense TaxID=931866 RepID=UPI003397639B
MGEIVASVFKGSPNKSPTADQVVVVPRPLCDVIDRIGDSPDRPTIPTDKIVRVTKAAIAADAVAEALFELSERQPSGSAARGGINLTTRFCDTFEGDLLLGIQVSIKYLCPRASGEPGGTPLGLCGALDGSALFSR